MGNSIIHPDTRDEQQTPLDDTYSASAGAIGNSITFFTSRTKGANGREVTNIEQAGQIPNGNRFRIFGMGFASLGNSYADLLNLTLKYSAVLKIGTKEYLEAPIDFFPGGTGISGFAATTVTATTISAINNGTPSPTSVQMLSPENSIDLPGGVGFNVSLLGTSGFTATTAINLRCYLIGVWEKFVQ